MKSILALLIAISSVSCTCIGQTQGSHITNATMTAFHGNWQWVSGTDTFKINFNTRPVFYDMNGGFMWDRLVGWYNFKRGTQIVFSNYASIGNTTINAIIKGGNENPPSNKVEAVFKDPLKDKSNRLSLVLNSAQNEIVWRASEIGRVYNNRPAPTPGMTLPSNMVLVKQ